jgi:GDP-L-fucose synthase
MSKLITGAWGLVGSEIKHQENTFFPTRHILDLAEYAEVKDFIFSHGVDELIHLAAKVGGVGGNSDSMLDFFNENLTINANIIRACAEYPIKKATFMLSTCVFPHEVEYPVDETQLHMGEPHPTNYGYAYSKRMLEVGARALRQQKGIQVRCVIPCNIYGKRDNYNLETGHVIPSLIHKCYLAKKNNTEFSVWGSGKAEREFVYAKDIAKAISLIHEDDRTDTPNIMIVSPSKSYTIKEIVEMIADAMKFKGQIVFDTSKPEGILRKPTKNDLFLKTYPKFEFTQMQEGIIETCCHVEENYERIRK